MKNIIFFFLVLATPHLLSSCVSCDDRAVTNNSVYRNTTLWGKETKETFRINLSNRNGNYGTFLITQEGKQIMALDFTSVVSNNGREIIFSAVPRNDLLTKWQGKHMNDNADYTVTVQLNKAPQTYTVRLNDVPPGYENDYAHQTFEFGMYLSKDKVEDYFNEIEFQEMKLSNGTGASLYFGSWVNLIYTHLFWIYAILFGILSLFRGQTHFWRHVILTAIMYFTFEWDFAPARAFIISYYLCTPLLYIPLFKNNVILFLSWAGTLISLLFLAYRTWPYLGLLEWAFYLFLWGAIAFVTAFIFMDDLTYRCVNCGRFSLGWRGRTERFEKAIDHYMFLLPDGSDSSNVIADPKTIHPKTTRCAHCMTNNEGEYN